MNVATEVRLRLILVEPPRGVDFGLQSGRGAQYNTIQRQQRTDRNITFEFSMPVAKTAAGQPNFLGPFAQGPPAGRFVYIDVGSYAGQKNTPWSRRIKVPLQAITWAAIKKVMAAPGAYLTARIPGTGEDGSPACATVRPMEDWQIEK